MRSPAGALVSRAESILTRSRWKKSSSIAAYSASLLPKVVVEQRLVYPGRGGNGIHTCASQAVLRELCQRSLQNGAPACLWVAAAAASLLRDGTLRGHLTN